MKITIGGAPGSGKTTIAKRIAERFGLVHVSAGMIFRRMAEEKGMAVHELSVWSRDDESVDREVDRMQKELAKDDTVTEGRMAAFMVDNPTLKIWLDAPFEVRVARIADREGTPLESARQSTWKREGADTRRYKMFYGKDIYDTRAYDLVINTEKWNAQEVFAIIEQAITSLMR